MIKRYTIHCGSYPLKLGERTAIMGVLNITPDSFSDGGLYFDTDRAVEQGVAMAEAGAAIIDIGGESTRPFAESISIAEEMRRVIPVISKLAKRVDIPLSIDTTKAEVARQALANGASIINDISALRIDPQLAAVAAENQVPVILMHMLGTPQTMQIDPHYDDLFGDITHFLASAIERARNAGLSQSRLIVDPGIGFGKTVDHNLLLIKYLYKFQSLDVPILIGPSRKAFIRKILKANWGYECTPDSSPVETGTQAAITTAILNGAHIVRVHDVANTRSTVALADALKNV